MRYFSYGVIDIGLVELTIDNDCLISLVIDPIEKNINTTTKLSTEIFNQLKDYLAGKRTEFSIPFTLSGTELEQKVYQALLNIPYGKVVTYKELAILIGRPKSARFIGNTMKKNKIPLIIPCHRVVGQNSIGGFAYGENMKIQLLKMENI